MPALSVSILCNFRLHIVLLVTALVAFSLLLVPRPAFGVGVLVDIPGGANPFPVGATVPSSLDITIAGGEFLPEDAQVDLIITGGQNVTFLNLPIGPGAFILTVGSGQDKVATLGGTVTHDDLARVEGGPYGYSGYGYVTGSPGTITYNLEFTHQILLDPAPVSFPLLPQSAQLFGIDVAGAVGGFDPGGGTEELPLFPDFAGLGEAFGANIPFEGAARALDARIVSDDIKLGAITDGFGGNNVYAQLVKGAGPFMFVESDFVLPDVVSVDCPGPNGAEFCDMSALHAIAFTGPSTFVVAGGDAPDGSDAFAALLSLTPSPDFPAGATVDDVIDLSPFLSNRPGGAAFDSGSTLVSVAEFQDDPASSVTVVKLSLTASLSFVSTFTTPLGFAGLPGFDGLGHNPDTGNFFGAVSAAAGAALGNDDIAAFTPIGGVPFSDSGSTDSATTEADEPVPCGGIGSTVWYRFTPDFPSFYSASTEGSNYDTVLAVYESDITSPISIQDADLDEEDCNDDFFGSPPNFDDDLGLQSRVDFFGEPGDTFYIQVGGFFGQTGNLNFSLVPEGNDAVVGGDASAIIEFDPTGTPIATHFIGDFPAPGQAITGLGIEVIPGDPPTTVIFGITQNTRTVVFAELGAAAARAGEGEFTNVPTFVNRDPETDDVLVGVEGDPNRLLVYPDGASQPALILESAER